MCVHVSTFLRPLPASLTCPVHADRQRWNALNLDAVICPNASHAAVPHDDYNDWTHTLPWNLLQCCALAIPVGKIEEGDMEVSEEYRREEPRSFNAFKEGLKKVRGEEENRAMCVSSPLSILSKLPCTALTV